ncbi:MAG: sensor histidine kinase [Bacilli bacterium]|nr:sensor histidine kinase [Bacilli bacterium]
MDYLLGSIDVARFVLGLILAEFILVLKIFPSRSRFPLRVAGSFLVALGVSQLYMLIQYLTSLFPNLLVFWVVLSGFWWIAVTFASALFVRFCFKAGVCTSLYIVIFGTLLQHIATVFTRFLLVDVIAPELPKEHLWLYLLLLILIYGAVFSLGGWLIRRTMKIRDGEVPENPRSFWVHVGILIALSLISNLCGMTMDGIEASLSKYDELSQTLLLLQLFIVGISLFYSVGFIVFNAHVNFLAGLRKEVEFQDYIISENQKQYVLAKSNIESINKTVHDLKHTIKALRFANPEEKNDALSEMEHVVGTYDSFLKTDNEALNVLLAEKLLLCNEKGIRLSCNIDTSCLGSINVIDLYTILGNAIDNAIDGVSSLVEDKRTISITIDEQGGLLFIQLENYFEGEIRFFAGFPISTKKDGVNHGYGLRSIQYLAKKYDGHMRVSAKNGVFTMRVIIPLRGNK